MKIKADRIAELKKFGWKGNNFEEADDRIYLALFDCVLVVDKDTRLITFYAGDWGMADDEGAIFLKVFYDLIKADMVEVGI